VWNYCFARDNFDIFSLFFSLYKITIFTMLDPQCSYVFLDFETTWLSHERDDIIQVGLIITNANLEIQSYFSSYINPGYEIEKLKTIVTYTTGITPEQIISWISIDEFRAKMLELIPNNSVFIWQNINFDIRFLKKYFNEYQVGGTRTQRISWQWPERIDTLERAKALIHYPASYSLDILYPIVRDQLGSDYFQLLAQKVGLVDIMNHDALSDCLICIGMMEYFKQRIIWICTSFPIAKTIITKSSLPFIDCDFINIVTSQPSNLATSKVPLLDFPEKPLASKILDTSYEWWALRNGERLYYGDLAIEQLIRKATGLEKVLICTNSRSKLSIIKAKCKAMWLYDISFIKEQQQVSKEKLNIIYSKEKLESFEWWFFLKYCSHKLQWLGLLDLNSVGDYKVYNFIRDDSDSGKSNIILATHPALFASLDAWEYADYKILFLDQERWYNSYLKYISLPRDPINFARVLDNFVYEDELVTNSTSSLRELMNLVDIFCGVLFMEIRDYIKERKPNKQEQFEIGVISWKVWFEKTNAMYAKLLIAKACAFSRFFWS
jgi:DNA polymerase III epsilon subunit-like protein